ncbi:MAG: prepilin peptidase [Patescibacteria group bacterium]
MTALFFALGAALGSFLNVVALRYDPDEFLFARAVIGGRSQCPHCRATLRWFELIPLVSFLIQSGRCRRCGAKISPRYFLVEVAAGMLALVAFLKFGAPDVWGREMALAALWALMFLVLLLVALIDFRLTIIPDEANALIAALGVGIAAVGAPGFGLVSGSFLGSYAIIFGARENIFLNIAVAVLAATVLFGALVGVTRGRGMGIGDLKLAVALALPFGWPDVLLLFAFAFIIGSLVGGVAILLRRMTLKSALPFGPFLALAALIVFLWAEPMVAGYFSLFGLISI